MLLRTRLTLNKQHSYSGMLLAKIAALFKSFFYNLLIVIRRRADIARLILKFLDSHHISISNCRGQEYDNGSNMAGKYNSAQAQFHPLAVFSPCACHSLNLWFTCS